jgi:hypothetical protein
VRAEVGDVAATEGIRCLRGQPAQAEVLVEDGTPGELGVDDREEASEVIEEQCRRPARIQQAGWFLLDLELGAPPDGDVDG